MSDPLPGERLRHYITRDVPAPFTYADLQHRYSPPVDDLPQTFAGITTDYLDPITYTDHNVKEDVPVDLQHTLLGLRDHLNNEDAWYTPRGIWLRQDYRDTYQDEVPGFTDETLDVFEAHGLLSNHGGIAIISSLGWRTIYHALSRDDRDEKLYLLQNPDSLTGRPQPPYAGRN